MRPIDADAMIDEFEWCKQQAAECNRKEWDEIITRVSKQPTVDAVPVPDGGIGELSDGYHTFNGLYYQRMMLFAALVKTYKDRAWKSRRHSDGEPCFGGGWFIVGIDTPQGGYTYHYEDKYFDLFDCVELPNGKEWDGHTEDDVTRLLTLDAVPVVRGEWHEENRRPRSAQFVCSVCHRTAYDIQPTRNKAWTKRCRYAYCPNCGCRMDGETEYVSTYSLGKISVPNGAIKQIIEDGKEQTDE